MPQGRVAEPTYALKVNRTALFHEIGHHLGHGPDHGMYIGWRDGALAGQTFRELLRLDWIADRYAARIPQIINSCLNSFPKDHTIRFFNYPIPILGTRKQDLIPTAFACDYYEILMRLLRGPRMTIKRVSCDY